MAYLDTRELAERLDELEAQEFEEDGLDDDDEEELVTLKELENNLGSEFRDGMTMISEEEFKNYAREFAEDIGAISDLNAWPATCIDWEHAANELSMDYTSIDYDGTSYYVLSR